MALSVLNLVRDISRVGLGFFTFYWDIGLLFVEFTLNVELSISWEISLDVYFLESWSFKLCKIYLGDLIGFIGDPKGEVNFYEGYITYLIGTFISK